MKPRSRLIHIMLSAAGFLLLASAAPANTWQVGPGKQYATPCAAIAAAAPGDTIQIDSSGNYAGNVCAWSINNLHIVGVGSARVVIDANGQNSQGKGTWVINNADGTTIENIEFKNATVPDNNGAGIRIDGGSLTVRNCYFHDNQDGILAGGGSGTMLVEFSEFYHNGAGDGFSHNIYVGNYAKFIFRYNYSHGSVIGHLVKSRAAENYIYYNRLSDEATGTASYEVDLPNGGKSFIIGNLIEKGPQAQNSALIAYQAEGPAAGNPDHELFVINNTMVNDFGHGIFIAVDGSVTVPAVIKNNIFQGSGSVTSQPGAVQSNNFVGNAMLVNPSAFDYHLQVGSPVIDAGADPGTAAGVALAPTFQYVHPSCAEGRTVVGNAMDIGAYEFNSGNGVLPANAPSRCGGSSTPAPAVTLSSNSLSFPSQLVGTAAVGESVTLTNIGTAALTISSVSISGANSPDFTQTNTCGSSLAATANCFLTVIFTPSATGTRSATLVISDNASGSPHSVALTGSGIAAASSVSLSPAKLTFASQPVGTTSSAQTITLSNSGNAALTVSSISVTGDFAQINTCGSSVAAGAGCSISVRFTPTASGTRTGTLSVADNASGSPHTASLTGTAPGAASGVSLSPSSLTFSPQLLGSAGASQQVKLTNSGTGSLSISGITATGDFSQTNNCGSNLAVSASCSISVTFKPTAGGNRTGNLSISDNANGSPHSASLTGTGQDFSLSASSSSASVNAGNTASFNVAVSPDGGFNQAISFTCSGAPVQTACTLTPFSVTPNGSAVSTVAVAVSTTAHSGVFPSARSLLSPVGPREFLFLFSLFALIFVMRSGRLVRYRGLAFGFASVVLLVALISGCAGAVGTNTNPPPQNTGTPTGTYTLTVTAASGSLVHTTKLSLTVN